MVSYADFITLLFAFFTVLYASSTADRAKLASVAASMQVVFASRAPGGGPTALDDAASGAHPDIVRRLLEQDLAVAIAERRVVVERDGRGVIISVQEAGSFASGAAELPPATRLLFAGIAATLRGVPNGIHVEGHTDDLPIQNSVFASNWDLSTARATRVVAFLQQAGIDPARLSAAGYAEFRPRVPNDSVEGRARNRRVDVVVLDAGR
jgi:chemotaxis protein MotB